MGFYGNQRGIDEIIDKFNLPKRKIHCQDPEIECMLPEKVNDLLTYYESEVLEDYIKDALMWMVMGAYEEYHTQSPPDGPTWERIKSILSNDVELHKDLIRYYGCIDEEASFPITYLMREYIQNSFSSELEQ